MTNDRPGPAAVGVRTPRTIAGSLRWIVPLLLVLLMVFATSARAHSVGATATCASVTFNWTAFNATKSGNGGLNTPTWKVEFKPSGGPATTIAGTASFSGRTFSLTVAIPSGNGEATASSSWTSAQTRDGHSGSKSRKRTISSCLGRVVLAPPVSISRPSLSTASSPEVMLGEAILDTAVLDLGLSPTGAITFSVYSASDTTCSNVLYQVTTPVSGNGSYQSPLVTPTAPGIYQWVATYGGDASNEAVEGACNDPNERSAVNAILVKGICERAPVALRGFTVAVRKSLTAHVAASGVKRVTFYLDGRRLATVTKPSRRRFSIVVNARRLKYGTHRLRANVTMDNATCANARVARQFVRIRPTVIAQFVG